MTGLEKFAFSKIKKIQSVELDYENMQLALGIPGVRPNGHGEAFPPPGCLSPADLFFLFYLCIS